MRATDPGPASGTSGSDPAQGNTTHRAGPRGGDRPTVVALDDPRAAATDLTGAKAANLAEALVAGLPGLGGFVLTTEATPRVATASDLDPEVLPELRHSWARWSAEGSLPLVVRSSSVGEDTETSSMAGQFTSVLDVVGWPAFVEAVLAVVRSADAVAARGAAATADIAVLVQPQAEAVVGGVLFGLDPLTGDRRHLLVSVVAGSPDLIVSGTVDGTTAVLSRRGRLLHAEAPLPAALGRKHRWGLARLAARAHEVFGVPQDIEWLVGPDDRLVLLQSRPVTASAVPAERSHALGPGPVAETFPDPLAPLERDLWLPPLDDGIAEALRISGAGGKRQRYVVEVHGRVAVDLEVLGAIPAPSSAWRLLDPRPGLRRLRAAWRLGRLRRALPAIVDDLVGDVDGHLRAVPAFERLDDHELVTVLRTSRRALAGLHAHEVLTGFLLDPGATATTGASVATAVLRRDRLEGLADADVVARHPTVLALLPPRIGPPRPLPALAEATDRPPGPTGTGPAEDPMAVAREALRLRVRWVQELGARTALALGGRLADRGQLAEAEAVRDLHLDEVVALVEHPERRVGVPPHEEEAPPLPAVFRLSEEGDVVADHHGGGGPHGVSAGRARAPVTHDPAAAAGRVLVVRNLDPALAPALGSLAALVAETGSPLSHLAILAREHHVPTVVGYVDALDLLGEGDVVVVDGSAGTVERDGRDAGDGGDGP